MAQRTRLGIIGHTGRMGRELFSYLSEVDDIEVGGTMSSSDCVDSFLARQPDVVVDLSKGPGVDAHGPRIVAARRPYIVGATGYSENTLRELEKLAAETSTPVLIVPNFSLGANLMIRFAAMAATLMQYPVITERHHTGKADAPSGTALFTARRIAERTGAHASGSSTAEHFSESHTGALGAAESSIALHSIRGQGYLAEQEVRFTLPGESLIIEHRSIDRRCFMPGIVYAARNIHRVQGLKIGLDSIMEF